MSVGRPLRFLALTVGGWTAVRVLLLWPPAETMRDLVRDIVPVARAEAMSTPGAIVRGEPAHLQSIPRRDTQSGAIVHPLSRPVALPPPQQISQPPPAVTPVLVPYPYGPVPAGVPVPPPAARQSGSRWSGSGWAILRSGGTRDVIGSRLGGAQAGIRIAYALGSARRVALAARLTTPLEGRGREAGVGVEWRPTRLPVRLVAEQRIALDGGGGGPMLGIVGGLDPTPVIGRIRLEAYAQVGGIARDGVEGFVDGAARLAHPLAQAGGVRVDVGVGGWGGAQRGTARLDIGPSLGIVVPVAARRLRLTLDWRERVAGNARPGSGPALSIGTDF